MSFDIKNNIICESNIDIINYLIQKLESSQRNLFNYANIFNSINSIESFYIKRKDIFNLFQNLEEELRQASLAMKALMVQNKALSEENAKILNIKKNYNKLLNENNYLLKENNNLSEKLKDFNEQDKIIKREKSPTYKFNKNNKLSQIKKNQIKTKLYGNKKSYSNTNINKISNKLKLNNKLSNNNNNLSMSESFDDIKGLKNAKNIIANMQKNKILLKEIVNEHFEKNNFQGSI